MVVLLDCEEQTLITRLNRRCTRLRRIEDETHIVYQRVNFFKQVSLPVVRYYDELGKLVVVRSFVCSCKYQTKLPCEVFAHLPIHSTPLDLWIESFIYLPKEWSFQ